MTPGGPKSDVSEAKTSDITKVGGHVGRDISGIMHEKAPSVSASQKLDTRSDLSQAASLPAKTYEQEVELESERLVRVAAAREANAVRKSLQVDDVSFASSSDLSYTIKNLDMSSILKHRRGHQVSFQTQSMKAAKQQKAVKDLNIDDVSIRSSQDSSDHHAHRTDQLRKPEVELDLPSDGGSTFRDFVPREVQSLEKQINRRDTEK